MLRLTHRDRDRAPVARRCLVAALAAATVFALPACGASGDAGRPDEAATLRLDATPDAVDVGIYQALARDFTGAEGVTLTVQVPVRGSGPVTSLLTGRARFAVLDLRDLAIARARGRDLVGVMALVQRPLATRRGPAGPIRALAVDGHGAPPHPELVLATTRQTVQDDPAVVRATVAALQRGYRAAISDPDSAVEALVSAVPRTDRAATARQLAALEPAFQATDGRIGTFDLGALRTWAVWAQRTGLVEQRPAVAAMVVPRFAVEGAAHAAQDSG